MWTRTGLTLLRVVGESWRNLKPRAPHPGKKVLSVLHAIPIIPWGGGVTYNSKSYNIFNTCNLDNQMQILYMLYKLFSTCASYIQKFATTGSEVAGELLRSFDLLNKKKFNDCRTSIFVNVMNTSLAQLRTGDMYGSEQSFLDKISFLVTCLQYRICLE